MSKEVYTLMTKVFVYGSLKKGYGNHRLLTTSKLLGEHTTEPAYSMFSMGSFPFVETNGETGIKGEVYEVNEDVFSTLDILEGYPTFYDRKYIDTPYGSAWMYFIDSPRRERDHYLQIHSGIWT